MTNKKVPKYRLNTIYAWMAHVLGEQDLAYELMTSKFFHYNQVWSMTQFYFLPDFFGHNRIDSIEPSELGLNRRRRAPSACAGTGTAL